MANTLVFSDNFTGSGALSANWGTRSSGTSATATRNLDELRETVTSGFPWVLAYTVPTIADGEVRFQVRPSRIAGMFSHAYFGFRGSGSLGTTNTPYPKTGYYFKWVSNSSTVQFYSVNNGTSTLIDSFTFTAPTAGTMYEVRLKFLFEDIKIRMWQAGTAEPGTWTYETTDNTFNTDGYVSLGAEWGVGSSAYINWDNFRLEETTLNTFERIVASSAATTVFSDRVVPTSVALSSETELTVSATASTEKGFWVPTSASLSRLDIDGTLQGKYGPIDYEFGLLVYDHQGNVLKDISEYVETLTIDYDESRTVKRSMNVQLAHDCSMFSNNDYLEPYAALHVAVPSGGSQHVVFPLGRYVQKEVRISIDASNDSHSLSCQDRTSILVETKITAPYTVPAGDNYAGQIRTLAILAGFQDRDIVVPATDLTVPVPITFEEGQSYYDIIVTLTEAINWWSPIMDNNDRLVIEEKRPLSLMNASVTYATDNLSMILPTVQYSLAMGKISNAVSLSVNDPLRAPFSVTYFNDALENPYSRSVTGETVLHKEEAPVYIHDVDHLEDRARFMLQEMTKSREVELITWVDFRRKTREVYNIQVISPTRGKTVLSGNWFCRAWSMDLSVGGQMSHQVFDILPV